MLSTHRFSTTALIVCFAVAQWRGTLVASEQQPASIAVPSSAAAVNATAPGQEATTASTVAGDVTDEPLAGGTELPPLVEQKHLTLPDDVFRARPLSDAMAPRAWRDTAAFLPHDGDALAQRRGYRGGGSGGRNDAARTAIVLGAVATIAGTAVLVYANRPECSTHPSAGGCGYGTKVVGSAVLTGGVVGLLVGALTWR